MDLNNIFEAISKNGLSIVLNVLMLFYLYKIVENFRKEIKELRNRFFDHLESSNKELIDLINDFKDVLQDILDLLHFRKQNNNKQ
jgi:predicted nucleotide-binding protein (sugar kinase/HSP70/actin superfamily)